jgi:putative ABC transport system permease protein
MSTSLRFALRSLVRTPGFTVLVVLCLALGIGVNVAFMGVLDLLLLRPPAGVRAPEALYRVETEPEMRIGQQVTFGIQLSRGDMQRLAARRETFGSVAAYVRARELSLGAGVAAREIDGLIVDGGYFPLMGVQPLLGRLLGPADARPDAPRTLVLSERLWRSAFGADSGIVGRRVRLNGAECEVVGVVSGRFSGVGVAAVEAWLPMSTAGLTMLGFSPEFVNDPEGRWLDLLARLQPGVSTARAKAVATTVLRSAPPPHGGRLSGPRTARLSPVTERFGGVLESHNPVPVWLLGATAALLLVACANVANLLLARGEVRRREIATRVAIGASRRALVLQLLAESAVLAALGTVAGLAIARAGVRAFALLPGMPPLDEVFQARVVAGTLGVTVLTTLLCGLVPAVQGSRMDPAQAMRSGTRTTAVRSRWRGVLMVGQLAAALALLVTGGVFVRSLQAAQRVATGIDIDRSVGLSVNLQQAGMPPAERATFAARALEHVRKMPGVANAARTGMPVSGGMMFSMVTVAGVELPQIGPPGFQIVSPVGEGYFQAAGLPLRRGRAFTAAETMGGGSPVTIVSESFARAAWKGADPLGRCVRIEPDPCVTVVGVAADVPLGLRDTASLLLYQPLGAGDGTEQLNLLVRASADPEATAREVRAAVQAMDPRLPYVSAYPLSEAPMIRSRFASYQLAATAFSLFGGMALLVAAIGLYAVVAYGVARRTNEIGVRVALGATARNIRVLVLGEGARHAIAGTTIGVVLGAAATHALRAKLYGVKPLDVPTFVVVTVVLLATALLASWLPARRAAAIQPTEALRAE